MKLIIISNRLSLRVVEDNNNYRVIPSPEGLSTNLDSLETKAEKHRIGWTGMYLNDDNKKEIIDNQLHVQKYQPVYLSPEQIEHFMKYLQIKDVRIL